MKKEIARGRMMRTKKIATSISVLILSIKKLAYLKYPNIERFTATPITRVILFLVFVAILCVNSMRVVILRRIGCVRWGGLRHDVLCRSALWCVYKVVPQ